MKDYRGGSWCDRFIEEGGGVKDYRGRIWRDRL